MTDYEAQLDALYDTAEQLDLTDLLDAEHSRTTDPAGSLRGIVDSELSHSVLFSTELLSEASEVLQRHPALPREAEQHLMARGLVHLWAEGESILRDLHSGDV